MQRYSCLFLYFISDSAGLQVVFAALEEASAESILEILPTQREICQILVCFGANTINLNSKVTTVDDADSEAMTPSENQEGLDDVHLEGWGLYVATTALNHSCSPNSRWGFSGSKVTVRTLKAVSTGEEYTVSYLPDATPDDEKGKIIKNKFGFECECARCCQRSAAAPN